MFITRIQSKWIGSQLTKLKDRVAALELKLGLASSVSRQFHRRIVTTGSLFGIAVLAITAFLIWAVLKSALEARSSENLARNLEEKTSAIEKRLDEMSNNGIWRELHVEQDSDAIVALIGDKTFARFDGYTSENNYCEPFSIYVNRANTDQLPVIVLAQRFEQTPPQVNDWNPLAVAADVMWKCTIDGHLVIHKGQKRGGIVLKVKPPEIYEGGVSKP